MGVYHKGGSNANDRKSIFDVSHDYVTRYGPGIWAYYKYKNEFAKFDIVLKWFKVNSGSSIK